MEQNGHPQKEQESTTQTPSSSLKDKPPIPNIIMLGVLFLSTIATIVAGYIHGNMHIETVLKNAKL